MASETAADVYGFDLAALQPHADRVGPEIASLVTPPGPRARDLPGGRLRAGQGERDGVGPAADVGDVGRLS